MDTIIADISDNTGQCVDLDTQLSHEINQPWETGECEHSTCIQFSDTDLTDWCHQNYLLSNNQCPGAVKPPSLVTLGTVWADSWRRGQRIPLLLPASCATFSPSTKIIFLEIYWRPNSIVYMKRAFIFVIDYLYCCPDAQLTVIRVDWTKKIVCSNFSSFEYIIRDRSYEWPWWCSTSVIVFLGNFMDVMIILLEPDECNSFILNE